MGFQIKIYSLLLIWQLHRCQAHKVIWIALLLIFIHNNFKITIGSVGGGLSLVIDGAGFTSNSTVTLCSKTCNVTKSSLTSITCLVIWIFRLF